MPLKTVLKSLLAGRWKSFLVFLSLFVTILSIFLVSAISNGVVGMYSSMLREGGDIIVTQSGIADTFFSDVDRKLAKKIAKIAGVKQVRALLFPSDPASRLWIALVLAALTFVGFALDNDKKSRFALKNLGNVTTLPVWMMVLWVFLDSSLFETLSRQSDMAIWRGEYMSEIVPGHLLGVAAAAYLFSKSFKGVYQWSRN